MDAATLDFARSLEPPAMTTDTVTPPPAAQFRPQPRPRPPAAGAAVAAPTRLRPNWSAIAALAANLAFWIAFAAALRVFR